jgi:hypothetical protein
MGEDDWALGEVDADSSTSPCWSSGEGGKELSVKLGNSETPVNVDGPYLTERFCLG